MNILLKIGFSLGILLATSIIISYLLHLEPLPSILIASLFMYIFYPNQNGLGGYEIDPVPSIILAIALISIFAYLILNIYRDSRFGKKNLKSKNAMFDE